MNVKLNRNYLNAIKYSTCIGQKAKLSCFESIKFGHQKKIIDET